MVTEPTGVPVQSFLDETVTDPQKRADAEALIAMMSDATGEEPYLWGPSIIGFGTYHYRYDSGHEGDAPQVAFAPRAREFSLYLSTEQEVRDALLPDLGPHRAAKGCVYVKRLDNLDLDVLRRLVDATVAQARSMDTTAT